MFFYLWANINFPTISILLDQNIDEPIVIGRDVQRSISGYNLNKNFEGKNRFKFYCNKIDLSKNAIISLTSSNHLFFKEDPYDGKMIIHPTKDGCMIIQETNLESYLAGVVGKEMNPTWPIEALKAQAVAARSYAISKIKENQKEAYHIINSERHQVGGHYLEQTDHTRNAVDSTEGEVLVNDKNEIVPAFYHAKCGERSFLPEEIWGNEIPGYVSVPCPYDEENRKEKWRFNITATSFINFLNKICNDKIRCAKKITHIEIPKDKLTESRLRVYANKELLFVKKSLLRKHYSEKNILSNSFQVKLHNNTVYIEGKGMGHGVGMGQLGALTMAQLGLNYKQILSYYYPNFKIKKVYP